MSGPISERYPLQTVVETADQVPSGTTETMLLGRDLGSFRTIFRLAIPLILSVSGLMISIIVNRIFLSWYSQEAIAAIGPAGMSSYCLTSLFVGAAGFASTFVAQYVGSRRPYRVGAAVWQGIYVSLVSGGLVAALAFLAGPLFRWVAHPPDVQALEVTYFEITCWGAPLIILASALSGFFSGRGDTKTLSMVMIFGFLLNMTLDFLLIFGHFGCPELGIAGAAVATVASQGVIALILFVIFLSPRHRRNYATWSGRRPEYKLFLRLLRFGLPNGARFAVELLAWNFFLIFVGRLGEMEGAATNIAWSVNGFAFFPVVGLSEAIRTLVGQAQGRGQPQLAVRCTWKGLLLAEGWMVLLAALFVLFPGPILSLFHDAKTTTPEEFAALSTMCVMLLRFVAIYCLLDGVSIVTLGALQGAGDTTWTLIFALVLNTGLLATLALLDWMGAGLWAEWCAATIFVMVQAFVWLARFHFGKWHHLRVVEPFVESRAGTVRP